MTGVVYDGEDNQSVKREMMLAKLGTHSNPAVVRVATQEKAAEIHDICESNG